MSLRSENALDIVRGLDFHLYHAKSSNESLLIHSFSVYSLIDRILGLSQLYSEPEKELMRWAALLHDYGKTAPQWQKAKRGPHRVTLGDIKYHEVRRILEDGIKRHSNGLLVPKDIEDILFIIEFHHGSGRAASSPTRNRMKDVVSECDRAVSQSRISEGLIRTLNGIIDTVRYRLFAIELIEHPISPLVIGAFDYVFLETGHIWALLYSPTSTLYAAYADGSLPPLEEVNSFLNEQLGEGKGVLRYVGGNSRIYTEKEGFLALASDPQRFVTRATALANSYCERQRKAAGKKPEVWSDSQEEEYLYGRVCGTTYNTILDLCNAPIQKYPRACLMAGGYSGRVTVNSLELLGLRRTEATYEQTLRVILEKVQPLIQEKLNADGESPEPDSTVASPKYDARDLLAADTSVYPLVRALDPKAEALKDYERYWSSKHESDPLQICPTCNHFRQGSVNAAFFPRSPLGGTVDVFYTGHMRRVKKEGSEERGVSFCKWCSKWWELMSTDMNEQRQLYHFCVMPHHLFARLEWRELLQSDSTGELVELGSPATVSTSGVYPHMAVLHLPGRDRSDVLAELVANSGRSEQQILDRLYQYGLKGAVITTNPVSSRHLLTCGSIRVETSEWPLLRRALRLLNPRRRPYARAIRALQQSPFAFGTFLADGSVPITKKTEKEVKTMVHELAEKTGLSFLRDIWIGGGLEGASKVIRGMNETLRRLKGKEDEASLVDAMVAKGLHLALSTRKGQFRAKENQPKEEAALRETASKLLRYKDQTYRRTELVRAMIYTLAYFSRPEEKPQAPVQNSPAA
jgi:HD domain